MADLIGFTSIILVSFITFLIAVRWPDVLKIIFAALTFRIFIMLIGHYLITLPDSTRDAVGFEWGAWNMAQDGFINNLNNFPGMNMYFYQWVIAIPYSIFGRSVLMMQSIGLFFGVLTVLLGWLLAKKLWGDRVATKVGWTLALFPTLALYSILPLREVYSSFFLLVAILGAVNWVKDDSYKSLGLAIFGFVGGTFFHGGIIFGLFIFSTFVVLNSLKKISKLLLIYRTSPKNLLIISTALIFSILYFSNMIFIPKLGFFKDLTDISRLRLEVGGRLIGDASYPEWLNVKTPIEVFYKSFTRVMFFLFSPFPWDVTKPIHWIGVFDGFLYMFIVYLIFRNRKVIWKDPALRLIFIILAFYFFAFAFGVSNFGAGTRHRTKFVIEMIILAGPLIPKLIFSKKKLRKYLR
jgi:hypothetical protein